MAKPDEIGVFVAGGGSFSSFLILNRDRLCCHLIPCESEIVGAGIALIFPVSYSLKNAGNTQIRQVLRLLVTDPGWNLQAQRGAVFASERLIEHLVAQQCLRMESGSHV